MKHIYLIRPKEDWGGNFKSSMTYQQAKAYAMVMARKESHTSSRRSKSSARR